MWIFSQKVTKSHDVANIALLQCFQQQNSTNSDNTHFVSNFSRNVHISSSCNLQLSRCTELDSLVTVLRDNAADAYRSRQTNYRRVRLFKVKVKECLLTSLHRKHHVHSDTTKSINLTNIAKKENK